MANKIILLDDHFPTGEPTVQLVSTWGRNGKLLREKTSCHKTASHSPALDYIQHVEPEPGKTIVLVVGLGDHETYGANRNGDSFPSEPIPGKVESDEVLPKHYKSYEDAHVYEHHVNSDPAKAIGKVKKAFWNPYMRRVEVLEDFDNSKAPHLLQKIASGEPLAKSMGCRIKYDVCSECGNKAKTRADYCDCLKYEMGRLDPKTGRQKVALNPSPKFFDSSWVIRPADRTGYMLKKVAYDQPYELKNSFDAGELCNTLAKKAEALRKAAEIEKVINAEPQASVSNLDNSDVKLLQRYKSECMPGEGKPNDDRIVKIMISYKPSDALGTSEGMGLPLGIRDILKYFLGRMSPGAEDDVDDKTVKSASAHLGLIYRVFADYPRFSDDVVKEAGIATSNYRKDLAQKIAIYQPQTVTEDYFYRGTVPASMRGNERGLTDTLTWTDPSSGQTYVTNYGTVQKTNDALVEHGLARKGMSAVPLLGAGALLGGASLAMGLHPKLRGVPQLATALGGATLGGLGAYKALSPNEIAGPKVMTDQGEIISGWTEMAPKHAAQISPEIKYLVKRASDGTTSTLSDTYVSKFLKNLKTAEIYDELSQYAGPTLDLDKVAQVLGTSILQGAK